MYSQYFGCIAKSYDTYMADQGRLTGSLALGCILFGCNIIRIIWGIFVLCKIDRHHQTGLSISQSDSLTNYLSPRLLNRCKCYQTIPVSDLQTKVLKPATSSSSHDHENGYSNSFTLCRGSTLSPYDMFHFDAST